PADGQCAPAATDDVCDGPADAAGDGAGGECPAAGRPIAARRRRPADQSSTLGAPGRGSGRTPRPEEEPEDPDGQRTDDRPGPGGDGPDGRRPDRLRADGVR